MWAELVGSLLCSEWFSPVHKNRLNFFCQYFQIVQRRDATTLLMIIKRSLLPGIEGHLEVLLDCPMSQEVKFSFILGILRTQHLAYILKKYNQAESNLTLGGFQDGFGKTKSNLESTCIVRIIKIYNIQSLKKS